MTRYADGKVENDTPLLEVRHVTKRFAGVCALNDVSLTIGRGEVHAVIGENGAGKSTLMKILAGVQLPDSGEILLDGKAINIDSVHTALSRGISLIHQELNLADNLDVGANIFLGREPRKMGMIDFGRIRRESKKYLEMVALDVSPTTLVSRLTIGRQQLVEIAKALSVNARILIMDEPTSSLSQHETEQLFQVIRQLRKQGVTVVYISHRLGEVKELADRVTVLRDGENAGGLSREQIDHDRMVQLMVGRDISQFYARRAHSIGKPVLEVKELRTNAWPHHASSFTVHAGEMLGVAGLVGAGRTEMLQAIFGVESMRGGEVRVAGKVLNLRSCRDAIEAGVALVPEDRKQQGLILEMSIRGNIGLPGLNRHKRCGAFLNRVRERQDATRMIGELQIKTPSDQQLAQYLSGGNQQKIVLAKWLAMEPRVLLLDEPTRGVDIGAKQEIYRLMEELAERGVAILFVSSEMEEVLSMSDRVIVLHEGRVSGELQRDELSEEAVMQLATGRELAAAEKRKQP
ncbi:MAG: sugar ABC transporter ATP-binding protein [Planctomycetota bacterium]